MTASRCLERSLFGKVECLLQVDWAAISDPDDF